MRDKVQVLILIITVVCGLSKVYADEPISVGTIEAKRVMQLLNACDSASVHFLYNKGGNETRTYSATVTKAFKECADTVQSETTGASDNFETILAAQIDNPNIAEAVKFHLSGDDLVAIMAYTEQDFQPVNSALWNKSDPTKLECFIHQLDSAIAKLPDYKGFVYRGTELPPAELAQHMPGHIVTYPGFISTSAEEISQMFQDQPLQLKIHSKHGKNIADFSGDDGSEDEVLFRPNTQFKVRKRKSEAKSKSVEVELDEN